MKNTIDSLKNIQERGIVINKVIDSPPQKVFNTWLDIYTISNWWAPEDYLTITLLADIREGGKWIYVMQSPEGIDFHNEINYEVIEEPKIIKYSHGTGDTGHPDTYQSTLVFEELNGKTKVTMTLLFESNKEKERVISAGAIEGANATLQRLNEFLLKRDNSNKL